MDSQLVADPRPNKSKTTNNRTDRKFRRSTCNCSPISVRFDKQKNFQERQMSKFGKRFRSKGSTDHCQISQTPGVGSSFSGLARRGFYSKRPQNVSRPRSTLNMHNITEYLLYVRSGRRHFWWDGLWISSTLSIHFPRGTNS